MVLKSLNSTTIRIQWSAPLRPNGIITYYTIYINGFPFLNVKATSGTHSTSVGGFSPNQALRVRISASTEAGEGPQTASKMVTTHGSGNGYQMVF